MNYYSIHNVFFVTISNELDYIATIVDGKLSSAGLQDNSLLLRICVKMGDEIQALVFESLLATVSSSIDAKELLTYFKVKENEKDGNII